MGYQNMATPARLYEIRKIFAKKTAKTNKKENFLDN